MNQQESLNRIVRALRLAKEIEASLDAFEVESEDDPNWADVQGALVSLGILRRHLFAVEGSISARMRIFEDQTTG